MVVFSSQVHYLEDAASDFVRRAVETAVAIHREGTPGDVMLLLPGMAVNLVELFAVFWSHSRLRPLNVDAIGNIAPELRNRIRQQIGHDFLPCPRTTYFQHVLSAIKCVIEVVHW